MKGAILGLILLMLFSGCLQSGSKQVIEVEMYKSPTCECCGEYAKYLHAKGFKVKVQEVSDPTVIKRQVGVPEQMWACHTLIVGRYYVEGHVPVEGIQKLLKEQPNIDGIALPGMPEGSPGMSGVKRGPFIIYSISKGEIREYTRL
jgi:hypothetical protein